MKYFSKKCKTLCILSNRKIFYQIEFFFIKINLKKTVVTNFFLIRHDYFMTYFVCFKLK